MQLGPYLVEAELGRGGVGVVYRARRPDLDRSYALKVLIAGEDASPEAAERFLREARAAASLAGHPNVVGVHDVGREGNRLYIAMDLVEGRSLSELLDSEGIGVTRALAIAEAMAGALAHAHESGVIHRDVKPANVLLEPDGRARLADFGLARRLADEEGSGRLTRTGTILGTPAYMAPEQALGDVARVDARSDIYSLGAVLYEMLTGRPPFEGDSAVRVLHRVLVDEPVRPRRRNPAVSRDVETVCLKALEKDPARRYADARAFEADLARARQGLPVAARPVGSARRLALWARRHPASSAVATAAALATVGLFLALAADRREWEREVETARRLARQGDAASALARFEVLLERDPTDPRVVAGVVDAGEALAAEAAVRNDWDALEVLAARLERSGHAEVRSAAVRLRDLELGAGTLRVDVAADDPRAGWPFFLYAVRTSQLERLPPLPLEARVLPVGEYALFSVGPPGGLPGDPIPEQFIFELGRGEELRLEVRTERVAPRDGPAPVTACLARARPGWRIELAGGVYRERVVVGGRHLRISGPGEGEPAVVDAGGEGTPLVLRGAHDVIVRRLQLARGDQVGVAVEASSWVTLEGVRVGGAQGVGFEVRGSSQTSLHSCSIAAVDVPGVGFDPPLFGYLYEDCTGGQLVGNRIEPPHVAFWTHLTLRRSRGVRVHENVLLGGEHGEEGIRLEETRMAMVSANRVAYMRHDGIVADAASDAFALVGNTTRENGGAGLRVSTPGMAWVLNNSAERNRGAGIDYACSLRYWRRAVISGNRLRGNGDDEVAVQGTEEALLEGNGPEAEGAPGRGEVWGALPVPYDMAREGRPEEPGRPVAADRRRWELDPTATSWGLVLPSHGVDSVQQVTLELVPGEGGGVPAVMARWREEAGYAAGWEALRGDEGAGLAHFLAGGRPVRLELRRPTVEEAAALGIRPAGLAWAEVRVLYIDLEGRLQEAEFDAAVSRVEVPGHVMAGEPYEVEVLMRNTGATPWVPGFQIALEGVGQPGLGLEDAEPLSATFPRGLRRFRRQSVAPWRPGPITLGWQMRVSHAVAGGTRSFGEAVVRTVEVDPGSDLEGRAAEARAVLEGRWVRRHGSRALWKVEGGHLRWLDHERFPYTMPDYDRAQFVDAFLLDGMPRGEDLEGR